MSDVQPDTMRNLLARSDRLVWVLNLSLATDAPPPPLEIVDLYVRLVAKAAKQYQLERAADTN